MVDSGLGVAGLKPYARRFSAVIQLGNDASLFHVSALYMDFALFEYFMYAGRSSIQKLFGSLSFMAS